MKKPDLLFTKGDKLEIGIDCVDISRFNKNIISKKNILKKIFTENEIQYCEKKAKTSQHYAARFAGKEAVVKAFSCDEIKITLNQIEILNKKNGIPFVKILNEKLDDFDIKISLSHSREIAMAVAIVSKNLKTKELEKFNKSKSSICSEYEHQTKKSNAIE